MILLVLLSRVACVSYSQPFSLEGLRAAKEHPDHVGLGHARHRVETEVNHWLDHLKDKEGTGRKNFVVAPLSFGSMKKRQLENRMKNLHPINFDECW